MRALLAADSRTTHRPFGFGRWGVLGVACAVAAGFPATAEIDVYQATSQDRDLVLVAGSEATWVEDGQEEPRILDLAPHTYLSRIEALRVGWVAGGTVATELGQDLALLGWNGKEATYLEPPPDHPDRDTPFRQGAVPLVEKGRLAGVAWLEGADLGSMSVRAASASGDGWNSVHTVSPALQEGNQLALSGAVLRDGSWILVWTAYDGNDDEVFWSRRASTGEWSKPARLHSDNDVFDITPAIAATPQGAVAAWSRFEDGHYRLRLAGYSIGGRLGGGRWTESDFVGGPGSLYPTLKTLSNGARLLFRNVLPASWDAIETDSRGRARRRARILTGETTRPRVRATDAEALFRWPTERSLIGGSPDPTGIPQASPDPDATTASDGDGGSVRIEWEDSGED